jgi:hypothetical protein
MNTHHQKVSRRARCKRCASKNVMWQQSAKTGKWFLTEVFKTLDGEDFTQYRLFHSNFCGNQGEHEIVQDQFLADEQRERDEKDTVVKKAQDKRENDRLMNFMGLIQLCEEDPKAGKAALSKRMDELAGIHANPTSLDYFTDAMREREHAKQLEIEIDLMRHALDTANNV